MKSPDTDLISYDPDPSKPLSRRLACLDKPVELVLGMHGWPQSSGQLEPRRMKGKPNARKIVKDNLPNPTPAEIEQLADRINWLQNNAFRWQVRDGYVRDLIAELPNGDHLGRWSRLYAIGAECAAKKRKEALEKQAYRLDRERETRLLRRLASQRKGDRRSRPYMPELPIDLLTSKIPDWALPKCRSGK